MKLTRPILTLVTLITPALPSSAQDLAPGLTFHQKPKPIPAGAVTEDWPRFLGPNDNATSGETKLLHSWPETGPALLWELAKGDDYTSPSIVGDHLVHFTRSDGHETVTCLHPETGQHHWTQKYPVDYTDRYGFRPGPRASPVIDAAAGRVYTFGVTAQLRCFDLKTGNLIWKKDLLADYDIPTYFFGSGPCPVLHGDLIIQNVGGQHPSDPAQNPCVVAFDKTTGEEKWVYRDTWGASYASPNVVTLHGQPVLLVLAGGESRPPHGGLLALDPTTGKLHARFPWRADKYESVNASSPIALPGNRVLISETYENGAVCLQFDESLQATVAWKATELKNHWITPVHDGNAIYSFTGRNEPDASLGAYQLDGGTQLWDETIIWTDIVRGFPRRNSFFRGSILKVDGSYLVLGESGTLAWMSLAPGAQKILTKHDPFYSRSTWSLPVVHRGLLYIAQHEQDLRSKTRPRLLCYDLRADE